MEPFTTIAGIMSVGSSVAGIVNSIMGRDNTSQGSYYSQLGGLMQANAQASADEFNAGMALKKADLVEAQGRYAAGLQAKEGQRAIGGIKAGYGASGVTSDSGSVEDVLAESVRNINADNMMILYNANTQAGMLRKEADMQQQAANNARMMGLIGYMAGGNAGSAAMSQNTGSILGQLGQGANSAFNLFNRK